MNLVRGDFIVVGVLCLLFAVSVFLPDYHNNYKCVNCNYWYKSTDEMVEIVPVAELAKVTKTKLRLCRWCAKHPKRLNIRNIERRERYSGIPEETIIQRVFLAQQLMAGSKFVRIQKNTSQGQTKYRLQVPEDFKGCTWGELKVFFKSGNNKANAIAAGYEEGGKLEVNPPKSRRIEAGMYIEYTRSKRFREGMIDWKKLESN